MEAQCVGRTCSLTGRPRAAYVDETKKKDLAKILNCLARALYWSGGGG